jgi:hypothetical protein
MGRCVLWAVIKIVSIGTRIVQADSFSDSHSDSRNKKEENITVNRLTPTVCTDPPGPATAIRTCAVKQRTFFAPTGADSRNRSRNLICLHCRLAPTLGIGVGTWICLHYTRTLWSVHSSDGVRSSMRARVFQYFLLAVVLVYSSVWLWFEARSLTHPNNECWKHEKLVISLVCAFP